MKMFLCRHGETTGDVEDRYGGYYDDHLTESGIEQSKALADTLADKKIEIIYRTPLSRSGETAEIIKQKIDKEILIVPELKERNWYGVLTGMTKSEGIEKYPDQVTRLENFRLTLDGGEGYEEFTGRVAEGLRKIIDGKYSTIAAVVHGGVLRNVFREILGGKQLAKVQPCAWVELDYEKGEYQLINIWGLILA